MNTTQTTRKPDMNPPTFDAASLYWANDSFTGEASDLGLAPDALPFGRLYSDAVDLGCVVQYSGSDRAAMVFVFIGSDRRAGEVLSWEFECWYNNIRVTLKIFND